MPTVKPFHLIILRKTKSHASLNFGTLFPQELNKDTVLIPWVAHSYSHSSTELDLTLAAVENSLKHIKLR